MSRIDEGLLDKNWRPSQKTVVETKVSLREKVAELNRKVGKLETCIANNEEQQTTNFNGVLRHLGAYSSSWAARRGLRTGLPADPLRKNSLIATWAFPSTS